MTIEMGYVICSAISMIFGMVIMALARVERGDLDKDDDDDFWADD